MQRNTEFGLRSEIDFVNFGVAPNEDLRRRVAEALAQLSDLGDLELRSAVLFYGSLSAAARLFGVSRSTYRQAIIKDKRFCRWKLDTFLKIPESDLNVIFDGSGMLLEMPYRNLK